jgi:hypothetical protein
MSLQRMTAVWEYSQHKGSALLLMLALADVADDLGVCWPGYDYLARRIRMTRVSAMRLIDLCHDSGELWKLARTHQRTNLYIVAIGLSHQDLKDAAERAIKLGVRPPSVSINLIPPPQVVEVVTRYYYPAMGSHIAMIPGSHIAMIPGSHIAMIPDPSLPVMTQKEDTLSSLWSSILEIAKGMMTRATFDQNLRGSTILPSDDGTLRVKLYFLNSVPWVDHRLRPVIEQAMRQVPAAHGLSLEFVAGEESTERRDYVPPTV